MRRLSDWSWCSPVPSWEAGLILLALWRVCLELGSALSKGATLQVVFKNDPIALQLATYLEF